MNEIMLSVKSFAYMNAGRLTLLTKFALILGILLFGPMAAADSLGSLADRASDDEVSPVAQFAAVFFILAGFIMIGVSLMMLPKVRKTQEGYGGPAWLFIAGVGLTSITFLVAIGSGTFFGDDQSGLDELDL